MFRVEEHAWQSDRWEKKWEQAQFVLAERRTWKRRLSITVGLRETRMVSKVRV